MTHQLPLPLFETRQVCMGCKKPMQILGQWSPGNVARLCKECSIKHPVPMQIFAYGYKGRAVTIRRDITEAEQTLLDYHVSMENVLHRLKAGCPYTLDEMLHSEEYENSFELPCEVPGHEPRFDCLSCRRRFRNVLELAKYQRITPKQADTMIREGVGRQLLYARWAADAKINNRHWQELLPVCHRCDKPHSHVDSEGHYCSLCQRCEDERAVESLMNLMKLHHGNDHEAALDRLHKVFAELFERGVLPDYYYQLVLNHD